MGFCLHKDATNLKFKLPIPVLWVVVKSILKQCVALQRFFRFFTHSTMGKFYLLMTLCYSNSNADWRSICARSGLGCLRRAKMGRCSSQMDSTWLPVHMWAWKLQNSFYQWCPLKIWCFTSEGRETTNLTSILNGCLDNPPESTPLCYAWHLFLWNRSVTMVTKMHVEICACSSFRPRHPLGWTCTLGVRGAWASTQ